MTITDLAPQFTDDVLGQLMAAAPGARDWRDDALCAQVDTELFFPVKGASTKAAKQVCQRCPAREECLAYALENDERFGVWGGLSAPERRALTRANNPIAEPGTED
jgi:WhiB family transcriptional regulator, redox-sensing transcriptional regulator